MKNNILELIQKQNPVITGIKLPNVKKTFNVYSLSISKLKFNPYNDRLAKEINEFELINNTEIGQDKDSQEWLETKLFELNKSRNETTLKDILKNKLMRHIVVDGNGIILDGNRRVAILRHILNNPSKFKSVDLEEFKYLDVVVVDEKLTREKIHEFETKLQISEDEKLDYDPINIYLKIYRLKEESLCKTDKEKFIEVANQMGAKYKANDIKDKLGTLKVMHKYLSWLGHPKRYIFLEKREDHFINIHKMHKYFDGGSIRLNQMEPSSQNKTRITNILFTYTSMLYEGKAFRKIVPGNKQIDKTPLANPDGLKSIEDEMDKNNFINFAKEHPSEACTKADQRKLSGMIHHAESVTKKKNPALQIKDSIKKLEKHSNEVFQWSEKLPEAQEVGDEIIQSLHEINKKISKIIKGFK